MMIEVNKMTPAALKYKDKLNDLEKCVEALISNKSLLSVSDVIELLKLQLEVEKELYRMECEDV